MTTSRHATLSQVVADALRHAIREGQYLSGERLVELTIAHEFNVSQNTVRDALHILEKEGWIQNRARRGAIVRSFDADEAEEIFALWASIERVAFNWATEKGVRVDLLARLRPPIEAARQDFEAGALAQVRLALFNFHYQIVLLANRPQTTEILSRLHHQAYLMDMLFDHKSQRPQEAYDLWIGGYERVLGIIKFGDNQAAQQALVDRILDNGKPIIKWLAMTT